MAEIEIARIVADVVVSESLEFMNRMIANGLLAASCL